MPRAIGRGPQSRTRRHQNGGDLATSNIMPRVAKNRKSQSKTKRPRSKRSNKQTHLLFERAFGQGLKFGAYVDEPTTCISLEPPQLPPLPWEVSDSCEGDELADFWLSWSSPVVQTAPDNLVVSQRLPEQWKFEFEIPSNLTPAVVFL